MKEKTQIHTVKNEKLKSPVDSSEFQKTISVSFEKPLLEIIL